LWNIKPLAMQELNILGDYLKSTERADFIGCPPFNEITKIEFQLPSIVKSNSKAISEYEQLATTTDQQELEQDIKTQAEASLRNAIYKKWLRKLTLNTKYGYTTKIKNYKQLLLENEVIRDIVLSLIANSATTEENQVLAPIFAHLLECSEEITTQFLEVLSKFCTISTKTLSGDQKAFFQFVLDINATPEEPYSPRNKALGSLDYTTLAEKVNSTKKLLEDCSARDSKVLNVYKEMSTQNSITKSSISQAISFTEKFKVFLLKYQEKLSDNMAEIDKLNKTEALKAVKNEVEIMNKKKNELDRQLLEMHQQVEKKEQVHSDLLYSAAVNLELKKEVETEMEISVKQHEVIGNLAELLKLESENDDISVYKEYSMTHKGLYASSKEFFKLFETLLNQCTAWWNLITKTATTEVEKYKIDKLELSKSLEKVYELLKQWEADRTIHEIKDFHDQLMSTVNRLNTLMQHVNQPK